MGRMRHVTTLAITSALIASVSVAAAFAVSSSSEPAPHATDLPVITTALPTSSDTTPVPSTPAETPAKPDAASADPGTPTPKTEAAPASAPQVPASNASATGNDRGSSHSSNGTPKTDHEVVGGGVHESDDGRPGKSDNSRHND